MGRVLALVYFDDCAAMAQIELHGHVFVCEAEIPNPPIVVVELGLYFQFKRKVKQVAPPRTFIGRKQSQEFLLVRFHFLLSLDELPEIVVLGVFVVLNVHGVTLS
jgi:hypothetical protein